MKEQSLRNKLKKLFNDNALLPVSISTGPIMPRDGEFYIGIKNHGQDIAKIRISEDYVVSGLSELSYGSPRNKIFSQNIIDQFIPIIGTKIEISEQ